MSDDIIFFTTSAPHPLTAHLEREGFTVHEALAISEVFALVEQHPYAQIVIASAVDAERAKVVQQRYPTARMRSDSFISSGH